MANVNLFRGGTPDMKGWYRRGDWPEFLPPFGGPMMPATPPYNSHADAAHGQGYLNLHFPLVPRLADTTAHHWMGIALRKLATQGDCIYTNWVPLRSVVTLMHWEVTKWDESLEGVTLTPTSARVAFDFDAKEFVTMENTAYDTVITGASVSAFPLDKPGDTGRYAFVENTDLMCTFGHDIAKLNADTGEPEDGLDDYFGSVLLGFKVTGGEDEVIAKLWKSKFAIYSSYKCLAFEGASQV